MAVLLLAEHDNKTLAPATAKALAAAKEFGGDVDILIAGENASSVADAAAKLLGVRKVLLAEAPQLSQRLSNQRERLCGQHRPEPLGRGNAGVGEVDVGRRRVST